jgi:hypothetical protein
MWQQSARRIVSAEITAGPGPLPAGVFDQAPRVLATLEDDKRVEPFSYYPQERSFTPDDFVGLTVDEGRRLKFAPSHARPARCAQVVFINP